MSSQSSVSGGSTDQHVSGVDETEAFPTDEPPTARTPSHGSSNRGINATRANRAAPVVPPGAGQDGPGQDGTPGEETAAKEGTGG
jgi:hypothetical protein